MTEFFSPKLYYSCLWDLCLLDPCLCSEKQDIVVIGTAGVGGYDGVSGNRQNIIIPAHGGSISLYLIAVHILKCAPNLCKKLHQLQKVFYCYGQSGLFLRKNSKLYDSIFKNKSKLSKIIQFKSTVSKCLLTLLIFLWRKENCWRSFCCWRCISARLDCCRKLRLGLGKTDWEYSSLGDWLPSWKKY